MKKMTHFVLQAQWRKLTDDDLRFKVTSGLMCGGPQQHAELCLERMFRGDYCTVAMLPGELTLDQVYQRTNTIDGPWWENPGVTKLVPDGCRSTSVGDVIIRHELDTNTVTLHVVSTMGFTEVTKQFSQGGRADG